ncbi:binding-protein-dependent transport system inner membrane protein [[Clostridium] cellulosi]|jgi:carbohydrate ABC transporter membrane protein 2, CUT1 family (TC 3.A.1.1.-)|uniref:Binding-protein-dependent transport system inner membrane protein n=1 Tax=[Clostridium] cellulosi TaxID=29343 RepID=A0A078KUC3_9FIRM|nr:binding-protein-dependent transport system inner membrane protein [[Clostridium] cellulosi]
MENTMIRRKTKNSGNYIIFALLVVLSILFVLPLLIILINSFKGQFIISQRPFELPNSETFVGLSNYTDGMEKVGFLSAFGWSAYITFFSVIVIVLFTAMTGWYITRVHSKISSGVYYLFAFSMIVPFQMVMFTMTKFANMLHLDNPIGIVPIYLGFGAGLSTFLYCGFIKSIPIEIEEAAIIDGCGPIQAFFKIIFPLLKPIAITVAILNIMWIWNDYLLPVLLIGSDYKTIPIAIQYLKGGYGSIDMGAMMAMLVLAIIPVIVFYMFCQKYIIEGVVAGAVKG